MDERTMLNLASFYDAIMKTNYDYGKNIYLYVIIFIIIVLVIIIIYQFMYPRIICVPIYQYQQRRFNNVT